LSWGRQELPRHVRRRPARIEHRRTATEIDYLDLARDRWGELHVDYPEPKEWLENRLQEIAEIFAVAVGGFSVMDNH
jgi:hypothetical protein